MPARRLLFAQLIALIPLAIATWAAVFYFLYWRIWWLDIPMHLLGGVWAGLCGAWIMARGGRPATLLWCVLFALFVGVAWELFEYSEGIAMPRYMSYGVDTAKDIVMDLCGAAGGYVLARLLLARSHER